MPRRVVVTGLGIISPIGATTAEFWKSCLEDKAAVAPVPVHWHDYADLASKIWAPLPTIDYELLKPTYSERTQKDLTSLLAAHAAVQALADAGLQYRQINAKDNTYKIEDIDPARAGVFIGTGIGGVRTLTSSQITHVLGRQKLALETLLNHTDEATRTAAAQVIARMRVMNRFNPFAVAMVMPNAPASGIGIKFSLTGPNTTLCGACAAGTIALGHAFRAVGSGHVDVALAGGTEYVGDDCGGVFRAFDATRVLAHAYDDPELANRPFDEKRSGFLFGEGGAAVMILEEFEHAKRRGANVYAEFAGYGETFDAHNIMQMEPSGRCAMDAIRSALAEAELEPDEIDYINAHGTGTQLNDQTESLIIEEVFGQRVLINSTKSLVGHTLGASGAIEAGVLALSIRDQTTHRCHNLEQPLNDLNFVTEVRPYFIRAALSQSFAFGGQNAVLVMKGSPEARAV